MNSKEIVYDKRVFVDGFSTLSCKSTNLNLYMYTRKRHSKDSWYILLKGPNSWTLDFKPYILDHRLLYLEILRFKNDLFWQMFLELVRLVSSFNLFFSTNVTLPEFWLKSSNTILSIWSLSCWRIIISIFPLKLNLNEIETDLKGKRRLLGVKSHVCRLNSHVDVNESHSKHTCSSWWPSCRCLSDTARVADPKSLRKQPKIKANWKQNQKISDLEFLQERVS